jgi:glutaredoxin-related protein
MYRSYTDLVHGMIDAVDRIDLVEFNRIRGLMDLYDQAKEESLQYGWIGVGCISYADNALLLAQSKDFDESDNYGQNNGPVGLEPEQ